jgi:multidrug efflux system membrane fusion protein
MTVEEHLMNSRLSWFAGAFLTLLTALMPGRADQPLVVRVTQPVQREVTDHQDFTGRIEASASVTLRARVSGYLTRVAFKDGADVKQGDLLFEIDPRPYQAALDQALAEVAVHEASFQLAKNTYERDMAVGQRVPGSVPQQQLEQDKAAMEEAKARVRAAKAASEVFRLNLEWTRVSSPINGRIGRRMLDPGNLVKADETALATIVASDPIYAAFEIDENTLLRLRRAAADTKDKQEKAMPILMQLADEKQFPHKGTLDFVDGQVNAQNGTVTARGVFENPKLKEHDRLFMPGMFVKVRLLIGLPHTAVLVPEQAIITDRNDKFVFVIDAENKVQYRRVTIGAIEPEGLRVINTGLKADEQVAVTMLKQLRPGMVVTPEKVEQRQEK